MASSLYRRLPPKLQNPNEISANRDFSSVIRSNTQLSAKVPAPAPATKNLSKLLPENLVFASTGIGSRSLCFQRLSSAIPERSGSAIQHFPKPLNPGRCSAARSLSTSPQGGGGADHVGAGHDKKELELPKLKHQEIEGPTVERDLSALANETRQVLDRVQRSIYQPHIAVPTSKPGRPKTSVPPPPMKETKHLFILKIFLRSTFNSTYLEPSVSSFSSSGVGVRRLSSEGISELRHRICHLGEKSSSPPIFQSSPSAAERRDLRRAVSALADELIAFEDSKDLLEGILDAGSLSDLLRRSPDGFASIELLSCLKSRPLLALEVFNWRKKQAHAETPLLAAEYSKAITLAGRLKNVDLAADLFSDSLTSGIRETCLYNSLMAAYMYNGFTKKATSIFEDLYKDPKCQPTIVSYNILLSIFGRSLLVDHMENVLRGIDESNLSYTITTYNTAIAAYVTAWMWDRMEITFQSMENGPVKPDADTLLLMLRGYAYAGNLEKMEKTYELVKEIVNHQKVSLIRAMICAYSKSLDPEKVRKIEALMKHIPEDGYRPWLNVVLIRMYAQEDLLETMERLISEAFERKTTVTAVGVMRSIISSYFRCNAVDRLAEFIQRAEYAGWKICRSLYHSMMVMYGKQVRLEEMHKVLIEMENYRFDQTKRTFLIMYKAYSSIGRRLEAETIVAKMWKHGFGKPGGAFFSTEEK